MLIILQDNVFHIVLKEVMLIRKLLAVFNNARITHQLDSKPMLQTIIMYVYSNVLYLTMDIRQKKNALIIVLTLTIMMYVIICVIFVLLSVNNVLHMNIVQNVFQIIIYRMDNVLILAPNFTFLIIIQ